ncbi:MAG TPA: VCBS repeat-containing protein, partial [Tepidisphaeraceae bacterium]|nr:VCBS repeat-containing protein [Tepidisphaeraceae bacterium]
MKASVFSGTRDRNRRFKTTGNRRCVERLETRRLLSAAVSFPQVVGYPGIADANHIAVADLNGDGRPDIVVIGQTDSATPQTEVAVYVNKGDGTFGAPIVLPYSARTADAVAIGDFNGDGVPDIAVASFQDASVSVFLGAGVIVGSPAPSFQPPVTTTFGTPFTGGTGLTYMQTGHFGTSSDGLVVTDSTDDKTLVLIGSGGGHFRTPFPILNANGQNFNAGTFVLADFNGDGISDIAYAGGPGVVVQFGTSGGAFLSSSAFSYPVTGIPQVMTAGVLTSSGKPDLIVATDTVTNTFNHTDYVNVLLNNGGGSFAPAVNYSLSHVPNAITLGDFNGDGSLDVATEDIGGNLDVFQNTGAGALLAPVSFDADSGTIFQMVGADLNGDGKADIAAAGIDGIGGLQYSDSVLTFIEG